jgi:hypothetical protein
MSWPGGRSGERGYRADGPADALTVDVRCGRVRAPDACVTGCLSTTCRGDSLWHGSRNSRSATRGTCITVRNAEYLRLLRARHSIPSARRNRSSLWSRDRGTPSSRMTEC